MIEQACGRYMNALDWRYHVHTPDGSVPYVVLGSLRSAARCQSSAIQTEHEIIIQSVMDPSQRPASLFQCITSISCIRKRRCHSPQVQPYRPYHVSSSPAHYMLVRRNGVLGTQKYTANISGSAAENGAACRTPRCAVDEGEKPSIRIC